MRTPATANPDSRRYLPVFFAILVLGVYLRLDQFIQQVLLDDEWHVVHQLLEHGPGKLVRTFGVADFSIPLALFYWLELKLFGLSELAMRWPMMLAGIAFLCLAPLYVRRCFDDRVALAFMFLLAVSPRLITYSRTARPYALTILISLLALVLFQKFVDSDRPSVKWGGLYVLCAVASSWLHVISLLIVVAPFLVFGLPALLKRDWQRVMRLLKLGSVTLAGLLLVLLPPMLGDPISLELRVATDLPGIQTVYGMLFSWLGTSSPWLVLIACLLALAGIGPVWRRLPVTKSLLSGLLLTLALILVTGPAWVQYPLTLSRYLLAGAPLLLLAVAAGAVRCHSLLSLQLGTMGRNLSVLMFAAIIVLMGVSSPLQTTLASPNSNSLHAYYQFDYRNDENLVRLYQEKYPVSPLWQKLAELPRESVKIAASPFSFETSHWDAARWERISGQRVMPGYLTGFCGGFWWGEVPRDGGFRFRNVAYLSDRADMVERGFDLLVFQKPVALPDAEPGRGFALNAGQCESQVRRQFPAPVHEDQWLLAIPLTDNMRDVFNAAR
jgi:hypothetical protein